MNPNPQTHLLVVVVRHSCGRPFGPISCYVIKEQNPHPKETKHFYYCWLIEPISRSRFLSIRARKVAASFGGVLAASEKKQTSGQLSIEAVAILLFVFINSEDIVRQRGRTARRVKGTKSPNVQAEPRVRDLWSKECLLF